MNQQGTQETDAFPITLTHTPVRSYYLTGFDVSLLLNLLVVSSSVGSIYY